MESLTTPTLGDDMFHFVMKKKSDEVFAHFTSEKVRIQIKPISV